MTTTDLGNPAMASRPSLFRPAFDLLVQYARYHRDRRNITTHLIGVPLIVFGVAVLLARGTLQLGPLQTTWAWVAGAGFALWILTRGEMLVGIASALFVGALVWAAHSLAGGTVVSWLAAGIGLFVVGWVIQFIGHYYEGRKPAFTDDLVGLLVGPVFVVLEFLAMAGLARALVARIEQETGPTILRDLAHPAPR
jgi:uncharacterized membrane protein YGL010W